MFGLAFHIKPKIRTMQKHSLYIYAFVEAIRAMSDGHKNIAFIRIENSLLKDIG